MTYYCKGKKMWKNPSNRTMVRLAKQGYTEMVWANGDFMMIGRCGQ